MLSKFRILFAVGVLEKSQINILWLLHVNNNLNCNWNSIGNQSSPQGTLRFHRVNPLEQQKPLQIQHIKWSLSIARESNSMRMIISVMQYVGWPWQIFKLNRNTNENNSRKHCLAHYYLELAGKGWENCQ